MNTVNVADAVTRLLASGAELVLFDIGGTLVVEAVPGTPTSALHANPLPGVLTLLDALAPLVRIGAVTNTAVMSEQDVRQLLEPCGIAARLEHIVTSSDVGLAKPDPAPLIVACSRFGVAAADAVYVGNDPVDGQAAVAAGMTYVDIQELLRRTSPEGGPTRPG
jgi:FMN phosphatase YigB (HAD superfamily)